MRFRAISVLACTVVVLAVVTGVAQARAVAITKAATTVKYTSATLNGLVDAGPTGSAWFFEYGTSKYLGSSSAPKPIGSGKAAVSLKLHHLKPGTFYYFRLVVLEGGYMPTPYFGAILSFKTKHFK